MSSHKKHFISFEDIDEVVQPEQIDCNSALIDMTENQTDVVSLDSQIQTVIADTTTLDKIANVIESNIEEGLSSQTAEVVGIVTESIYNKYNLKTKLTPGHESFTEVSKVVFTAIAFENVKEAIDKIWKMIISAIKTAYNTVVEFLKKIFRSATGVKQKAEKLQEKVKLISSDSQSNQADIQNSANVASEDMGIPGGKKLSASSITLIFADKTDAPSVFRATEALIKQLNSASTLFQSADKSIEITQTLLKEFGDRKAVDNISYPTFTHGLQSTGSDGHYRSEAFPGGMALLVKGAAESSNFKGLEAIHAIGNTNIHIGPWNSKQEMVHHKAIPVLNKASIQKLLADSMIICTIVEKIQPQADKMQERFKALTNDVSQFKVEGENPTQEMKQAFNDLKSAVTSIKSICSTGLPSFLSYSLRTGNALVDYCYVSTTCYNQVKA